MNFLRNKLIQKVYYLYKQSVYQINQNQCIVGLVLIFIDQHITDLIIIRNNKYKMNSQTSKAKQQASKSTARLNDNKSPLKTITSSQYFQSLLSLIIDQMNTNQGRGLLQEIIKLENPLLRKKLLELNQSFQSFNNRVKRLQYFQNYLNNLFSNTLKDGLVKPSLNSYKYEAGLIEAKVLEDVIRMTNNSKMLYYVIDGWKPNIDEYNQFCTENVVKYIGKIVQRQPLTKIKPAINEQQLIEQFTKLSNGTFNKSNTKMMLYCQQKATLDLLQSINNQIVQGKEKVKRIIPNNFVLQKRDPFKNVGILTPKPDKKFQPNFLKQDLFKLQNSLLKPRIVDNQLLKESKTLTDKNQKLAEQIKSKQQSLKDIKSYEIINQQNKRLSVQISYVKASNQHQLSQIRQLQEKNRTIKEHSDSLYKQNESLRFSTIGLESTINKFQIKMINDQIDTEKNLQNCAKQLEEIQQSNRKIDEQRQMIEKLSKQHEENVGQRNRLSQFIQKYKQELVQIEICFSEEKEKNIQLIKTFQKKREILLNQKGLCELNLKLMKSKNQSLINQQYIKNLKMKNLQGLKERLHKRLIEERSIFKKDKKLLLQKILSLIKMGVIKNGQRIKAQTQTIDVNYIMNLDAKNHLLQKIVRITKDNQEHLQEIRSLEGYVDYMQQNQSLSSKSDSLSQKLLMLNNQNSQTNQQVNVQFRLGSILTKNQYVSLELYFLKQVQNKHNFQMISKIKNQKRYIQEFLQSLVGIQMSQRQQHFYFQKKLFKTIIFNSQKMQQIKNKINETFHNLSGLILEFSPTLQMSYIQNIQFDVINYIRQIESQINVFNKQSLEQCGEIQIDD